jgi:hypothetical protein
VAREKEIAADSVVASLLIGSRLTQLAHPLRGGDQRPDIGLRVVRRELIALVVEHYHLILERYA